MQTPIQFISVSELMAVLQPLIENAVEGSIKKDLQEKLLSIDETRKLFSPKISRPTLDKWTDKGILARYYVGGRPYYRYSEIIAAIQNDKRYKTQSY